MGSIRAWCFIVLAGTGLHGARANDLRISNISLVNVAAGELDIQCDVSWENSWRSSWTENGGAVNVTSWDAVWLFAKVRQSGGLWRHVLLTPAGHTATGGTVITPSADRLGAFVHRTAEGSGTQTCTAMRLHWNYAAAGLGGTNELDIAVFGTEMVYVPEGGFVLGSGGTEAVHFYQAPDTASTYPVSSEDAIDFGPDAGKLGFDNGDATGAIPAGFPKGFQAIYAMKYEISEGQYVDFLNLLDPGIITPFFPNVYNQNRHTIHLDGGQYVSDAPDRACGFLGGDRLLTWMDWAGLRPMTELEFEKMSRGARNPWINEFVWGNTSYVEQTGHQGVDGSGTETALPADANIHIVTSFGNGPVRCGIYGTGTSTREQAGAGYYGNMNLGGNIYETVVSVSRPEGRAFTDAYGDGNEYTSWTSHWPANLGLRAYGLRGLGFGNPSLISRARSSDRTNTDGYGVINGNGASSGGRAVRTAP